MKDTSFFILLGVDGCGKSTLIEYFYKKFPNQVISFHFCPSNRYNNKFGMSQVYPHSKVGYSFITSFMKLLFLIIIFNISHFNIRRYKDKYKFVIGDRYFYDLLFDPKRYRMKLPRLFLNWASYLIPRPDKVIVILGDVNTFYTRKRELNPNLLAKQQSELRTLSFVRQWKIIESHDLSVSEICQLIINELLP